MEQEIKRQTAFKTNINELARGQFVKKQGWESSYVMTEYGDFSRVNIIGVIVAKENNAISIDDGTGTIQVRSFEPNNFLQESAVGDIVLIIGKPREYNNQLYITLEILKKIDPKWINYRRKELTLVKKIRTITSETPKAKHVEAEIVESETTMSSKERIIQLITQFDAGSGASIDDVIVQSKIKNAEDILQELLLRGEIFELKPGYVKVM